MFFRSSSLLAVLTLAFAWGCGGSDSGDDSSGGTGGAAGSATGGAAGAATGGAAGSATGGAAGSSTGGAAGSSTGGAAGSSTGGAAGSSTGGAAGSSTGGAAGSSSFWPNDYNPNGSPKPSNGEHNAGQDCLSCHKTGGSASGKIWLFGGTVYKADKTSPAAHVQVGVDDGTQVRTAYTGSNGNFWLGGNGTINWASAAVRIRNANGEVSMVSKPTGGGCNSCHTGALVIVEP